MNRVRIGIVGMGQRTCFHGGCLFKDCADDVKMAAVCDNRPERLQRGKAIYEEQFGYSIDAYDDFREMYDKANLDGVFVAGPNHTHRDMAVPALKRGIHLLCEKPMELTLAKCDEIIAAARENSCTLATGMQMRYRRRYHKVRELVARGVLGRPAMVWCTEYRNTFNEMKDWVWERDKSGGAIVEKNCHHYDIFNLWLQSKPTTVYASGSILKHKVRSGKPSEIIDNAWVMNDYENGARAMVGICFLGHDQHDREFGLLGTEGKVSFSRADDEVIHVELNNGDRHTFDCTRDSNLHGGQFRDFVDCIRTGRAPFVTGEHAKASLLVPLAAEISLAERRIVHVDELT